MEYSLLQVAFGTGGGALFLLAAFVLNPDGVSRVTEALLERIEVRLALRRQRRTRAARGGGAERARLTFVNSWQEKSGL